LPWSPLERGIGELHRTKAVMAIADVLAGEASRLPAEAPVLAIAWSVRVRAERNTDRGVPPSGVEFVAKLKVGL